MLLDGVNLFEVTEASSATYATYKGVSVDVSAYADDGSHTLKFDSSTSAGSGALNFFVDGVCLSATALGSGGGGDGGGGGCFIENLRR